MERPAGLPSWEELVRLPEADARKLLEPLVSQYDDEVLGEWFGVSSQRVGYFRRKLGLEKARGRGGGSLKRPTIEPNIGGGTTMTRGSSSTTDFALGLPQGSLELSLAGRFTRDELFKKLEKLRAVVELLDAHTFSVSIQISELGTPEEQPEFDTDSEF